MEGLQEAGLETRLRKRRMSSRHPATKLSSSGSPPSSCTRRLRNASSCCAFTSAADICGRVLSMRRVRSIRSSTNGSVLLRCHRAPDFVRQLLADHTSFPQSASPHCKRHDQPEWSESRELNKTTDRKVSRNPMWGSGSLSEGSLPAATLASAANSGSALFNT